MAGRRRDSKQSDTVRNVPVSPINGTLCYSSEFGEPCNVCWINEHTVCDLKCTNIGYILKAACDYCDNTSSPVTSWNMFCSGAMLPDPSTIPAAATPIPSWATVMASETPTPTGTFDIQDVLNIMDGPRLSSATSQSGPSPTSVTIILSSAASPSTSSEFTSGPSSTSPPTRVSGSSKGKSQAGPIAGGIIGAIAVVACIGAGLWYRARRRKRLAPSAAYRAALRSGAPPMPYQPVDRGSPKSSIEELSIDRPPSPWLPSRPVSIRSESRFREHT
ncbi:hypothetical protein C8R47DRAFT_329261 [Mycena vitilis]|nr:hypothetical protein C8R47DRAFT_329261 [Mycena vitilis]